VRYNTVRSAVGFISLFTSFTDLAVMIPEKYRAEIKTGQQDINFTKDAYL
jgi:hypothetical protein